MLEGVGADPGALGAGLVSVALNEKVKKIEPDSPVGHELTTESQEALTAAGRWYDRRRKSAQEERDRRI